MKRLVIFFLLTATLLAGCSVPDTKYAAFARCLTEKGVKMYGTFWCPNCQKQKADFGDAFKYIKYIECDARGENNQADLCLQQKIENVPTWEFNNGSRLVGRQDLSVLAEKSGCTLESAVETSSST